jgi:hypothetical protein
MKLFTGWVSAVGLVLAATGAHAQIAAPSEAGRPLYRSVSDVSGPNLGGPYAAMPPEAPGPGYGPTLLPSIEVYTVVREAGLSPLGIPHLRGFIYTIAVIDRSGNDGRLIIDARTGRIIRLVSARGTGDNFSDDPAIVYGAPGTLPPTNVRGAPRPPRTIPHVASRSVPVPKASPLASKPVTEPAAKPAPEQAQQQTPAPQTPPPQQTAATTPKPAEAPTPPPAAATTGTAEAKPAAQIAPTQDMPKVQGLE